MTKLTSMGSLLRSHSEVCHFLHRLHLQPSCIIWRVRRPPSNLPAEEDLSGLGDWEMQVGEGAGVVGTCGGLLEGGGDYAMKAQSYIQASRHRVVWCSAVEWSAV